MYLRILGLFAMLTAPAMLVDLVRNDYRRVLNADTDPTGAVLYGLFALGWLAAMIGLRELRATGSGRVGRVIATLPLVTLPFAAGQTFMDLANVPTGHPLYLVTDLAWPLSMVFTFVVSVAVLFAPALRGWHRFVPLYCGISLPLFVAWTAISGQELPISVFAWHTATGWALLGFVVFANARRAARAGGRSVAPVAS